MTGEGLSRRKVLAGAGVLATGAFLGRLSGGIADATMDVEYFGPVTAEVGKIRMEKWPWPYVKLDPAETAERAYHTWYRLYCGGAVIGSIFGQLAEKVGEPYKSFPCDAFIYMEGGITEWGTICGSNNGANLVTNLIIGPRTTDTEDGALMGTEIMQWYSDALMPVYVPKKPMITTAIPRTISHSPLCHISVGRWMKASKKPMNSPERKHRCASVSASVAYHLVELLNQWKDGKYVTKGTVGVQVYNISAQPDCEDCHGSNVPIPPAPLKKTT
ncbi:MAG: C-GCAxxG-C-C family protein [Desulfobacteraceae bacterium]|nr:C-GCAxxG-C-C family protein [Desulfobacteraceae bacterium]